MKGPKNHGIDELFRKAEAYNRSLIEASLDPLVTINPNGTISDVNAATVKVTGYSREELIGTDFSDYFTDPDRAKAGYETVFRDGSVRDYELKIRHKNGQITPVLYNATVYRDESGNIAGVFAAARDITERKKAEEARASLAAIVENSDDGIIGKSLDGVILSWNKGAEKLYGFSASEAIGHRISMLVPPGQKDDLEYLLEKLKKGELAGLRTGSSRYFNACTQKVNTKAPASALRSARESWRDMADRSCCNPNQVVDRHFLLPFQREERL